MKTLPWLAAAFTVALSTVCTIGLSAAEDHLVLKSGQVLSGTFLGGNEHEVRFAWASSEQVIPRGKIRRIDLAGSDKGYRERGATTTAPVQTVAVAAPSTVVVQQPAPQVVYVQQPAPQIVYVERPAPPPRVSYSIGIGAPCWAPAPVWGPCYRPWYPAYGCGGPRISWGLSWNFSSRR